MSLKEQIGAALPFGPEACIPWPEQKRAAERQAADWGFDVEQILCNGTLEDLIVRTVPAAIRMAEKMGPKSYDCFLKTLAFELADTISMRFRHGDDISISNDAIKFASALLYLFPKLWRALNKPLTLEKIKALDFDSLLSQRRATRPRKRQTPSVVARQKRPSRRGG